MRWFGGAAGQLGTACAPAGARLLTTDPATWIIGDWPAGQVRLVRHTGGTLVVIGPCSASDAELGRLSPGLPDSAATAWSGAYTLVFAKWDGLVTILTDPACACPIYLTRATNNGIVWASSSRALAGLTAASIDETWLAASLAAPAATIAGRSAWADVGLVPPGHRLSIRAGRPPVIRPAWQPPRLDRRGQDPDRVRQVLAAAVDCRISGNPSSADLSGGLDSSTLAVLAARRQHVTAVTVHPAGVDRGGDLDHARATAAAFSNLHHLLLPLADEHLPYTGVNAIPVTDEPAPSTPTWSRLAAELQVLRAGGVTCHLTGDGGDTLFSAPPVYLADLARAGRWLHLSRHAHGWARLRHASPWSALRAAAVGDLAPLSGRSGAPGLTSEGRERAAGVLPAQERNVPRADHFLIEDVRHAARTARTEAQLADTFGIAMENPYLDARLLDLTLAIPARSRVSPRRYKPILSAAAAGLLPESVRTRAAKGTFATDHYRGLRKNLRELLELADGELAQRGLVRPDWLRQQIRRAALGLEVSWSQVAPILSAEIWVRRAEGSPPVPWVSSTVGAEP